MQNYIRTVEGCLVHSTVSFSVLKIGCYHNRYAVVSDVPESTYET